jgi:hypothetical protein
LGSSDILTACLFGSAWSMTALVEVFDTMCHTPGEAIVRPPPRRGIGLLPQARRRWRVDGQPNGERHLHAGDMIFRAAMPDVFAATIRDIKGFADSL